ncbi:hypothetical protein [Daejeonella oryzae]|uniref:hypothetical protein n=1 Tax=Daejeonella oryzae TaxID=1122943 RepID=UPI00047B6BB8|nr:hypothetical protein [Daejeonella oryzae]
MKALFKLTPLAIYFTIITSLCGTRICEASLSIRITIGVDRTNSDPNDEIKISSHEKSSNNSSVSGDKKDQYYYYLIDHPQKIVFDNHHDSVHTRHECLFQQLDYSKKKAIFIKAFILIAIFLILMLIFI